MAVSGRPPTTVEGEVRATVRQLRGLGVSNASRLGVMRALLDTTGQAVRYGGTPDRRALVRLAAHAQAWAEEAGEDADA
jgi:hypothetical protein